MNKVIERRALEEDWETLALETTPLLKRLYAARGITQQAELDHHLQALIPFDQLKNIELAVDCLVAALKAQQRIIVVGDFDADGATSSALAVSALTSFGALEPNYLVPNRFEYGYGLTPEIVQVASQQSPDLIITVDNGISSVAGVKAANDLGIKVLVTDHHLPGSELPDACAIVNPNQPGCPFPSKNLAGVGVIFYVMLALRKRLREEDWFVEQSLEEPNMADLLDLVALGTVADVVPLDGNNRILVQQGLARIRCGKTRPGIQALLDVSGRNQAHLSAMDLGFALGPRLNAAGRLDDMALGISLLLAEDSNFARELAVQLDSLNRERKTIEADMQAQAISILQTLNLREGLPMGLCLYDPDWHQGVIGLLASRIKERVHRPVVAFARVNDTEIKGSARSITGLHIRDVFETIATRHPELLTKFGGHAMAAGLTLQLSNLDTFKQAFDTAVREQLCEADLCHKILSDGALTTADFTLQTAHDIRHGGPWGQAFPEPLFDQEFVLVSQRIVGQRHLKMTLSLSDSGQLFNAIAFNVDTQTWPNPSAKRILAAYRLDINEYRGQTTLQLLVEHLEVVDA